jgi:hypothetical protein
MDFKDSEKELEPTGEDFQEWAERKDIKTDVSL